MIYGRGKPDFRKKIPLRVKTDRVRRKPVGLRFLLANLIDILLYGDYQRVTGSPVKGKLAKVRH